MESQENMRFRPGADPRRAPADKRATPVHLVDAGVLTRRSFLAAGVAALGLPASACGAASVAHGRQVRLRLTLSAPTGPCAIGTVQLHLVDHSRRDPWVPSRPRELMISIWYPAVSAGGYPPAPYMPQAAGALFLGQLLTARILSHQITRARVSEVIGTIQPTRAVVAERAYIAAFFDLQLRGLSSANTLLSGPSPKYPEIQCLGR
jgi:hypothetical protein